MLSPSVMSTAIVTKSMLLTWPHTQPANKQPRRGQQVKRGKLNKTEPDIGEIYRCPCGSIGRKRPGKKQCCTACGSQLISCRTKSTLTMLSPKNWLSQTSLSTLTVMIRPTCLSLERTLLVLARPKPVNHARPRRKIDSHLLPVVYKRSL